MNNNPNEDLANKKLFSPTNVIIIIGFVVSIMTNQFLFKMQVQEIILNNRADNRVYEMRFAALEKQDQVHDLTLQTIAKSIGEMIEVTPTRVPKNRK